MLEQATMIVEDIEHQPFRDGEPHITLEGTGTEYDTIRLTLKATATTTTGRYKAYNEADLLPAVTLGLEHDRDDTHDVIKSDIIPHLDDEAARTARRILQLDSWIDEYDPTRPSDIHTDVVGSYNPLRPTGTLAVITESNDRAGQRTLPVIATIGNHRNEEEVKRRVDSVVERRAVSRMRSMQKHHYRNDDDRTIVATEYATCDSLEEAQRVLRGGAKSGDADNDDDERSVGGADGEDRGCGQVALTSL